MTDRETRAGREPNDTHLTPAPPDACRGARPQVGKPQPTYLTEHPAGTDNAPAPPRTRGAPQA
ncbi:hypothetical protein ABTY15_34240, partial [Kitasatospora sp. NPDC097643]